MKLRRVFAWLIGLLGIAMLLREARWIEGAALATQAFAPLLGGILIGLASAVLWVLNGRIAGVSGIAGGLLRPLQGDLLWRASFLLGIGSGGVLMHALSPSAFEVLPLPVPQLVLAGLLVGVGTAVGSGCTSGHGVCGLGRFSPRSLVAVGSFMATGMVTVYALRHVLELVP